MDVKEKEPIKEYWLTTSDNPYDPFEQYDQWYLYDTEHGYDTSGLIARLANVSLELSDEEYTIEVNRAIGRIIELGLLENAIRVENKSK